MPPLPGERRAFVLQSTHSDVAKAQRDQVHGYLSEISHVVHRGSTATRSFCALCGKSKALHFFKRRKDHYHQALRPWRCTWLKRDGFEPALRSHSRDG